MKVKIGSENKATVNIKQGGGEYNAFSLNPEVAQTTIEDGVIKVEGLNNGKTEIIISDKDGHYRKIPVSVYTIDNLTLKNESIEFVTRLGCSKTIESNVLEGNGGYSIVSSNKAITASITKEGIITLTGASKPEKITAIVTVTDCSGFTTEMTVHLIGTNVAYTNEELESIKATSTSRYYLNEYNTKKSTSYKSVKSIDENGRRMYGWEYGSYYFRLHFDGGIEVGKKTNAVMSCHFYKSRTGYISYTDEPITFEIIKNDGINIWGTYSFIKDNVLNYGYFCDQL